MTKPSPAYVRVAEQLLRLQGIGAGGAVGWASAARGVHDALHVQLAPIIGAAGFEVVFRRSVKLTGHAVAAGQDVHASLHELEPPDAAALATTLLATFLALLATFIGDALACRVLKTAFPACNGIEPKETEK